MAPTWSPNRGPREGHTARMIVIHGDAGTSDAGTVSWCLDPASQVSYHFLVGRAKNYELVPVTDKAWHAGKSEWPGVTFRGSVNHGSIGVAFANDGKAPFLPEQIDRGAKLCASLCMEHSIPVHMIRGHFEVSPGRKTDPWDHFPWEAFWLALCRASR